MLACNVRHEDPRDAPAGHPPHAGQCPPPLLLRLLHLWHSWCPALGWASQAEVLHQPELSEHSYQQRGVQRVSTIHNMIWGNILGDPGKRYKISINKIANKSVITILLCYYPSIPSLYYTMDDDGGESDYICSKHSSYGMHQCDNLPLYKLDGKVFYKWIDKQMIILYLQVNYYYYL